MKVGDDRTEVAEWDLAMSFHKGDNNSAARLWLMDAQDRRTSWRED